jgi:pimeloyl-ACP methyl ester carboxylesterase
LILKADLVTGAGASPSKLVVFLHGILGSGANLRSQARRFVDAFPHWQVALLDLRAHGHSLTPDGRPDTLASAALDVLETAATLPLPLRAVVGHSFGGKVALEVARSSAVPEVMTLDSAPGPRTDARGSETTAAVIALLGALPGPWNLREDFIRDIERSGIPGVTNGLAQWLAMNLARVDGGLRFRLSLPRIHALLRSYLEADLWPEIETGSARFHLVIGTRSEVYTPEDRSRAEALAGSSGGRVSVDLLDSGHWVHVDDPDGLARVLAARLGPA